MPVAFRYHNVAGLGCGSCNVGPQPDGLITRASGGRRADKQAGNTLGGILTTAASVRGAGWGWGFSGR